MGTTTRRGAQISIISCVSLWLAGCAGAQSVLQPSGPGAARIDTLWWVMFWTGTAVFVLVLALLAYALFRRRQRPDDGERHSERTGNRLLYGGGVALPLLVLLPVLGFTAYTSSRLTSLAPSALTIDVIAHQFWWEVRYPEQGFVTANEIHIPVGQPVEIRLRTVDVIHSFWVPRLHGKVDMIPGQDNSIRIQADEVGTFRGQCAEFCGVQHALMAFEVTASPPEQFAAWVANQQQPARTPSTELAMQGRQVLVSSTCVYCHVVRGVTGDNPGVAGPDLTHLASRSTLAAGTIPNTRGNLGGWIMDPQAIKPGSNMPASHLDAASLQALLAYLESLE